MTTPQLEIPPGGDTMTSLRKKKRSKFRSSRVRRASVARLHIGIQDMVNVLKVDNEEIQVNMEQIERVKTMHERFLDGSQFSFNYNTLLLVASVLAGIGLISNSSSTIIASMLVSPIMGPVTGMAYGASVRDWSLCRKALKTEILSLLFCIGIGVIICSCTGPLAIAKEWPTDEMSVRGTWQNVMVALPVAFFSGLGVAVSVMDEQASSLVGVAISASLLPPAVNSGILWIAWAFHQSGNLGANKPLTNDLFSTPPPFYGLLTIPPSESMTLDWNETIAPSENMTLDWNETEIELGENGTWLVPTYDLTDGMNSGFIESDGPGFLPPIGALIQNNGTVTEYDNKDYAVAGCASLILTISNIVLIIAASVLMFRLKEKLPIKKSVFWTDLGVARKIYRDLAVLDYSESPELGADVEDAAELRLASYETDWRTTEEV